MPLHRRLPKRGFNNVFAKTLHEVNLGRVQAAIDAGKLHLDASAEVDAAMLVNAGVLRRAHDGVRLLGDGELKAKINFVVYGASKSAIAAVEKTGGSVKVLAPKREAPAEPKGKNAKRLLAEARGEKPKGGKAKSEAPAGDPRAERPKAEKPKADQQAEKPGAKGDKKPQTQAKGGKGDKGKGAE
jgi:large subunit ribosomal protein L15